MTGDIMTGDVQMQTIPLHCINVIIGLYDIPRSQKEQQIYKEGFLQRKNELDEGGRKV